MRSRDTTVRAAMVTVRATPAIKRAGAASVQGSQVRVMGSAALKRGVIEAERFIQTMQKECLDHFVACGTTHLDYLVCGFVEHYHTERPHQGLDNRAPFGTGPPSTVRAGPIRCAGRLGGRIKHYYCEAA